MKRLTTLLASTAVAAAALSGTAAAQDDMIIGLITKADTNPFFVKMKEGAAEKAEVKTGITTVAAPDYGSGALLSKAGEAQKLQAQQQKPIPAKQKFVTKNPKHSGGGQHIQQPMRRGQN